MSTIITFLMFLQAPSNPPPVHYTPPYKCTFLPEDEWEACDEPESWDDFCLSVTNYWPFDEHGNLITGNGQTDSDPTRTAVGIEITSVLQSDGWVALPLPLINNGVHTTVCLTNWKCFPAWDTFGDPTYQAGGFWHSIYNKRVIGVDVFTSDTLHYLDCDGVLQIEGGW